MSEAMEPQEKDQYPKSAVGNLIDLLAVEEIRRRKKTKKSKSRRICQIVTEKKYSLPHVTELIYTINLKTMGQIK